MGLWMLFLSHYTWAPEFTLGAFWGLCRAPGFTLGAPWGRSRGDSSTPTLTLALQHPDKKPPCETTQFCYFLMLAKWRGHHTEIKSHPNAHSWSLGKQLQWNSTKPAGRVRCMCADRQRAACSWLGSNACCCNVSMHKWTKKVKAMAPSPFLPNRLGYGLAFFKWDTCIETSTFFKRKMRLIK